MIDWIKTRLPYDWQTPISGGSLLQVSPDGEVRRQTVLSEHCRGSYDEHLVLRTVERGFLELDGNPSKFMQGHNLFGSNDLCGLVAAAAEKALGMIGHQPSEFERQRWLRGHFDIGRVDLTESFELDTAEDCRAWLHAAGEVATMKWRGRATMTHGTLYFGKVASGKRGSRWSLKIYHKGDELGAVGRGHKLPWNLPHRDELHAWAQNKLRVEVLLRNGELDRLGGERYTRASQWTADTPNELFSLYFAKIEIGDGTMCTIDRQDGLRPAENAAVQLWRSGIDLRGVYPRTTLYRHRSRVLRLSGGQIDLLTLHPKGNVVPLRRVLELRPASAPSWASETALLFKRRA